MKKLTLDLDALSVESFDTDAAVRAQGTVHAHELTEFPCGFSGASCDQSCKGTCVSCNVQTDPCLCDPFHPDP